jgi:FdhE protein
VSGETLETIAREHPEWTPWLGVLAQVMRRIESPDANPIVEPGVPAPAAGEPMLAGALVRGTGALPALFQALLDAAEDSGAPAMAGLGCHRQSPGEAATVFRAAIDGDDALLATLAGRAGTAGDGYLAVAGLLPVPFLQACRRAWTTTMPVGWNRGYCPVCGAWPSLAQTCGIERQRYLRCGRCGSAWQMPRLACAYCNNDDHEQLVLLVAGEEGAGSEGRSIEACLRCRGYLKAFNALQPGAGEQVMLADLASIDLDIVATGRDYRRPPGLGHAPCIRMPEGAVEASA